MAGWVIDKMIRSADPEEEEEEEDVSQESSIENCHVRKTLNS